MGAAPAKIGPYEVLARLGEGGMAETFVGVKRGPGGFEQRVCVKRMRGGLAEDPEYVRQFLAEARIAATLRHTNIAQVVDFGQDADGYWLALELIEGMDLRVLLARSGGRLRAELVAHVGAELAAALEVAHRSATGSLDGGIVHRDLSPSNVLLSLEGEVKLADFGIARRLDEPKHTRTGIVRGKLQYMAPEYAEHGHFDHRGDLFALGVVLYETLAGQRPHDAPGEIETLRRAIAGEHPPVASLCPEAPSALCTSIERLIDPDPARRFQSAAELLDSLLPLRAADARRDLARLVRARRTPDDDATRTGGAAAQNAQGAISDGAGASGGGNADATATAAAAVTATAAATVQAASARTQTTVGAPRASDKRTGPLVALAVVGLPLLIAAGIWIVGHDIRPARPRVPATDAAGSSHLSSPAPVPANAASTPNTTNASATAPPPINGGVPSSASDAGTATAASTATAQLIVVVLPFGTASVDGSPPRRTPFTLELSPGPHELRADGEQHFERTVQLEAGQKKRVVFQ